MKKLLIYNFFDDEGIVSEYVFYFLKKLCGNEDKIIFVVNGKISDGSRETLKKTINIEFIIRKSQDDNLEVWGEILHRFTYKTFNNFEEIILASNSIYGPICSGNYIFESYIQCSDLVVFSDILLNDTRFIKKLNNITYLETLNINLLILNKKIIEKMKVFELLDSLVSRFGTNNNSSYHGDDFSKILFNDDLKFCIYVDLNSFILLNIDTDNEVKFEYLIKLSSTLPILNKKFFINSNYSLNRYGEGFFLDKLINKIKKSIYPFDLICKDILRTQKLSTIKDALVLTSILEETTLLKSFAFNSKIALICYGYYPDQVSLMCDYISNMPSCADILIYSSRVDTLEIYKKEIESRKLKYNYICYQIKPNQGRDLSALLVAASSCLRKYKLFCFIHDKKSKHTSPSLACDFLNRCLTCCLYNKNYVISLINELNSEAECGILMPPIPYFDEFITPGAETLGKNSDILKMLFAKLKLKVKFDARAVAPFGTMFWARTEALKDILDYPWKYEDFPSEPMPPDFTISHGIERVFAYCAQNRGFYSRWIMPPKFASIYINNLSYRIRDYNCELYRIFGVHNWFEMLKILKVYNLPIISNSNIPFRYFKYLRYKVLYKFSFGLKKMHYKKKYYALKVIKRERRIKFF